MSEIMTTVTEETETTTYKYLHINEDYKFRASLLCDLLPELHKTSGYRSGLTNPTLREKKILEALQDLNAADKTNRGVWFETDEDILEELYQRALNAFYDEENVSYDW